jgi:hypothetical protein
MFTETKTRIFVQKLSLNKIIAQLCQIKQMNVNKCERFIDLKAFKAYTLNLSFEWIKNEFYVKDKIILQVKVWFQNRRMKWRHQEMKQRREQVLIFFNTLSTKVSTIKDN